MFVRGSEQMILKQENERYVLNYSHLCITKFTS